MLTRVFTSLLDVDTCAHVSVDVDSCVDSCVLTRVLTSLVGGYLMMLGSG